MSSVFSWSRSLKKSRGSKSFFLSFAMHEHGVIPSTDENRFSQKFWFVIHLTWQAGFLSYKSTQNIHSCSKNVSVHQQKKRLSSNYVFFCPHMDILNNNKRIQVQSNNNKCLFINIFFFTWTIIMYILANMYEEF